MTFIAQPAFAGVAGVSMPAFNPDNELLLAAVKLKRAHLREDGYYPVPVGNASKHPNGFSGWQDARPNDAANPTFLTYPSHLNTGIHTSGFRVVDIDVDDAALAARLDAEAERLLGAAPVREREGAARVGRLYATAETTPPGKLRVAGAHHGRGDSQVVEILGHGQQFVVGERHSGGARYVWRGDWGPGCRNRCRATDLTRVTEEQVDVYLARVVELMGGTLPSRRRDDDTVLKAPGHHAEMTLDDIGSALSVIRYEGYDQWVRLAAACRAANPSALEVFRAWMRTNKPDWEKRDDGRVEAKWRAPLAHISAGTLIALARKADPDWRSPSFWQGAAERAAASPTPPPLREAEADPKAEPEREAEAEFSSKKRRRAVQLRSDIGSRPPPPREWVFGKTLQAGYVSVLGAAPAAGKTTLSLAVALSVATGRSLLDPTGADPRTYRVHERRRVWVYNLEDPIDEMERRLSAAVQHFGLRPSDFEGHVYLTSGRDDGLITAVRNASSNIVATPHVDELVDEMRDLDIGVLLVDPFSFSHSADENSNAEMNHVLRGWNEVAQRTGAAVWLIHHFRKGGEAGAMDSFRGAGAISQPARVMETLRGMTLDEAAELSLDADDRVGLVRWDDAKGSMSPPGGARWLRLLGQALGNGDERRPQGDNVQVIAPVDLSNAAPRLSVDQVRQALADIETAGQGGNPYWRHHTAGRWVGNVLMERGLGRREARRIVDEWVKAGWIVECEFEDQHRNARRGYVLARPLDAIEIA
jgi:hypothetical protein